MSVSFCNSRGLLKTILANSERLIVLGLSIAPGKIFATFFIHFFPGANKSLVMASASMILAPRLANMAATVDLPVPKLPVRPMTSIFDKSSHIP